MRSMTAFARTSCVLASRSYTVEIFSLNRRGLEITTSLPPELSFLEMDIRNEIKRACERGHISVRCVAEQESFVLFHHEEMKRLDEEMREMASAIGRTGEVTFDHLLNIALRGGFRYSSDEEHLKEKVLSAIEDAAEQLIEMRRQEGKALEEDIGNRLVQIEKSCDRIAKQGQVSLKKVEKRLRDKLTAFASELNEDDRQRLSREVVFYADKYDISEELTRMRSHLEQMKETLSCKEEAIGRKLEFLLQEMSRETHTISAKSPESDVIKETIYLKQELEKIREQGQNIE